MASNLSPGVKVLQDTLVLFSAVYFMIVGIEIAANRDPEKKSGLRFPPDTLKMVASFLLGVFLLGLWGTALRKSGSNNNF